MFAEQSGRLGVAGVYNHRKRAVRPLGQLDGHGAQVGGSQPDLQLVQVLNQSGADKVSHLHIHVVRLGVQFEDLAHLDRGPLHVLEQLLLRGHRHLAQFTGVVLLLEAVPWRLEIPRSGSNVPGVVDSHVSGVRPCAGLRLQRRVLELLLQLT